MVNWSVLTVNINFCVVCMSAVSSSSLAVNLTVDGHITCRSVSYAVWMRLIIAGIETEEVGWGRGGVMLTPIRSLAV